MDSQIQSLVDATTPWLAWLGPYLWLQAIIIVAISFVLAIVAERLIVATVGRVVQQTNSRIDDDIVLNCAVYKAFAVYDIEIPFPQQDLHIKSPSPQLPM